MRRVTLASLLLGVAVFLLSNPSRIIAYLTDLNVYQPPNYYSFIPPAAGSSYVDPVFGTTITRLSDAMHTTRADSGGTVVSIQNEYSTMSPFNSNDSYILLAEFSYFALYDGATGTRIKPLCCEVNSNSEPRWSRTNPAIFYYHFGNQLKSYNVTTDVATVIHTFSEYGSISANGESEISYDGDHLVLAGDGRYVFVYTISTGAKGSVFDTAVGGAWDSIYITPNNNVLLSWITDGTTRYHGEELYDSNMNFLRQAASYDTHKRVTRDMDGSEILVQFNGNDPRPIPNCNNGLVKINLTTLQQTCLLTNLDWSLASHITTPDATGWVFMETYNPTDVNPGSAGWVTYTNEILQVKLDGTQIRRLAHHRSRPLNSYTYQPKASVSHDGTRLVYGSNYGLQTILGYPTEYSDAYMILVPGATTPAPTPTPTPTPSVPVITTTSLPAGTQSAAYSATLTATSGTGVYTWSIASGTLPTGLALASSSGIISGVPTTTGTSSFTAKVTDGAAQTATQALGITVNAPAISPLVITTTSLPTATQSTPYSATVTAAGGAPPYAWSIASGALPPGLSLGSSTSTSVVISGTPTGAGTSSFTVQVTDPGAPTATAPLSIAVSPTAPTSTNPFALWTLDATTGSTASDTSGNNNTVTLSNAPSWLSGSNCIISGCLSFNGANQAAATSAALNLSDTNVVTVAFWMYWNGYSSNDSLAMESTPNFNNSTTGFMIDPNSSSGTGTQFEAGLKGDGGYNQVLFARPSASAWHHYALVFNKGAAAASEVTPYVDGVAVAYTKPNSASNTNNFGADTLYWMSRAASSLFGAGRLDDVRIYKRTLSASEIQTLATVSAPPAIPPVSITTTSLPSGTQNAAYSATLTATGGTGVYTWSVSAGTLPAGLGLAASTGVISGTPTATGTSSFTITVTDGASLTATVALSITINAPPATALGPFALWTLDATTGSTASDSSGNNNTVTLSNAPSWLSGSNCIISGCLSFNGANQAAATSAALNLSDTNVVTVAFWMYWNGYSSNDSLAMESTPNFNNAATGFMIDPNSSSGTGTQFEAGLKGDGGYNQVLFARPSAGAWHHYALVFNKGAAPASEVTPYVDGVAVVYTKPNSASNTNNFGADTLYWMSRAASSLFGAGRLDDVRIYKRALSASEVQTLATVSVAPPPAPAPTVAITTTSLPSGRLNNAYLATLAATGGTTPYSWSIVSGSLPAGLTLSSTGVISGVPTASGQSSFTVRVTDSKSATATQALTLWIRKR